MISKRNSEKILIMKLVGNMGKLIENLETLQCMITEMHSTTSMNEKRDILEKYRDNWFIMEVLKYTYHPYMKYGIHAKTLMKKQDLVSAKNVYGENLFALLRDLHSSEKAHGLSGNNAIFIVNSFIQSIPEKYHNIIYGILSHDLNIGVTATTIVKTFPYLIPIFKVALAQAYEVKNADFQSEEWYASRKLDGVRCICRKENNSVRFFSRTGNEFTNFGPLAEQIRNIPAGDFIFDGEICIFENGTENFTAIASEIHRKNHTIHNAKFLIFDCLTLEEFDTPGGITPLSDRLQRPPIEYIKPTPEGWYEFANLEVVEQTLVESEEHFNRLASDASEKGYEGLMLRKNVPYEGKRSKNLLKVKKFQDAEYEVIDAEMGIMRWSINGENVSEECLTNIKIRHKGTTVSVGSGFSREQRQLYYAQPDLIIGKTACIQYFEESQNKNGEYSLRFPVVKHIYNGARTF